MKQSSEKICGQNLSYYNSSIMFAPHGRDRYAADPAAVGICRGVEPLGKGTIALHFFAPEASTVEVALSDPEQKKTALVKNEFGWWSGKLENLIPGYQPIQFYLNGIEVLNPHAPIGFGANRAGNFAEVPDDQDSFDLLKDVPHGSVRSEIYYSATTKRFRNCIVYTPPGYDNSTEKYPLLFLQHGGGENENCWLWQGKINYICDNLLAEGAAIPCVIVMNSGYAYSEDPEDDLFDQGQVSRLLVEDCLPFITERFHVCTDRDGLAIAGLSMGSFQTNTTLNDYPDTFSWAGIFSGDLLASPPPLNGRIPSGLTGGNIYGDIELVNSMKLIFVGFGDQERNCESVRNEVESLRKKGARPLRFETYPGVHEWRVWRRCVHQFLQLIFR